MASSRSSAEPRYARAHVALAADILEAGLGSSADFGHAPSPRRIAAPDLTSTRVVFYDYVRPED